MGRQQIQLSRAAADAAAILGQQVRLARHERKWTAAELADRAGVSARTVTAMEKGSSAVSLGNALNLAVTVGVPLFGDRSDVIAERRLGAAKLALMPSRVYRPRSDPAVDLDF
ncbi:helix-turn-helix transcriptional regulator [Homoserinimonas sp. A447]